MKIPKLNVTNYDLKQSSKEDFHTAPSSYKWCFIGGIAVLALCFSLFLYKCYFTISNQGTYQETLDNMSQIRSKIAKKEAKIQSIEALTQFFDKNQEWINGNYASSLILEKIFMTIPSYVALQEVKLERESSEILKIYVRYQKRRRSEPNPIQDFTYAFSQIGYTFELENNGTFRKGGFFFDGKINLKKHKV